jgi:hypothetical protein
MSNAYSISTCCAFDIVCRYRRCSISKVTLFDHDIEGDKPSISKVTNRVVDIEVSCLQYRLYINWYRMLISYTISKVFLTFDIKVYVRKYLDRYRIRYSIHPMSFTAEWKAPEAPFQVAQAASRRRRRVSVPRALVPGFLHPLFAEFKFHSLIHRDLTRKGPSIAPHPRVDFEKPAPSPAVGSWIRCTFPWDLTPEEVRNGIDWYWYQSIQYDIDNPISI